jgi:hypothetical protein
MKSKQLLLVSLVLCFGLAACRTERKPVGTVPEKQTESELNSSTSSSTPPAEKPNFSDAGYNKSTMNPTTSRADELSDDEKLQRVAELERADVFNVPVSDQVAQDRAEAWKTLAVPDIYTVISKEQYLYAHEILDRYREATLLEKLVFWRLVELRLSHQGISGTSTIFGDDYRQLRIDTHSKLMDLLYSGLGENPEKLPEYLAVRRGIEMLKVAASGNKQGEE